MKLLLLALIVSFNLKAQDDCVPLTHDPLNPHIHKLLEWFGASEKQIADAPCKIKTLPSEEKIQKFIQSKSSGKENATIHGVNFKDESPELIEAFKDFTTAKDQMGFSENKTNQKEIQSEFKINPECDKVMCAMEKIWGKDIASKMVYLKLKHGFNTSELAFNNSSRFTKEELDDVVLGIEDLPKTLTPLGKNQRLTLFLRGYTLKDYSPSVIANAVVMLFDAWSADSSASRQYTIFHEMAHNISSKLGDMDESPEWLKLSEWVKKGDDWTSSPDGCYLSKYGKTNPAEDYAESLTTYRYNAGEFKTSCPDKYNFLKEKVFKGVEYTEELLCTPMSDEQMSLAQKALTKSLISEQTQKVFSKQVIEKNCKGDFGTYPITGKELARCSLKLNLTQIDPDNIKKIFKETGILDNDANRELILKDMAENLVKDQIAMNQLEKNSTVLGETIDKILKQSFLDANPKEFSQKDFKSDSWEWREGLQKCGEHFFKNEDSLASGCLIEGIVKNDQMMQRWDKGHFPRYKQPEFFKEEALEQLNIERDKVLIEHLKEYPIAKDALKLQKEAFRKALMNQHLSVRVKLYDVKDWKKLSAQDFCKMTYGTGSSYLQKYGFPEGRELPVLYNKCVEIQSTKSKRYELKEEDWEKLINSL